MDTKIATTAIDYLADVLTTARSVIDGSDATRLLPLALRATVFRASSHFLLQCATPEHRDSLRAALSPALLDAATAELTKARYFVQCDGELASVDALEEIAAINRVLQLLLPLDEARPSTLAGFSWKPVTRDHFVGMRDALPPAAMRGASFLYGEPKDSNGEDGSTRFLAFRAGEGDDCFIGSRPITLAEFDSL